jgi:hypothetical protein
MRARGVLEVLMNRYDDVSRRAAVRESEIHTVNKLRMAAVDESAILKEQPIGEPSPWRGPLCVRMAIGVRRSLARDRRNRSSTIFRFKGDTVPRTYRAEHFGVARVIEGNQERGLDPRLDLRSFSVTGFSWGYKIGGPQQLGLAILCDMFDDRVAVRYCEEFTNRAIATRAKDAPFEITENEVRRHVEEMEKANG